MHDDLEQYRAYVHGKLDALTDLFAKAAVGDFSENIDIPDEEDDFLYLYTGIQVILDVIRNQIAELRVLNISLEAKVAERTSALAEAQQIARLGSWQWTIKENVMAWSDELYRIYGLRPQEILITYEGFLHRVHPEDRDMVHRAVQSACDHHVPFSLDHRVIRPDGDIRIIHARGEVLLDSLGKPLRMIGTGQDVTEQRIAEEARRESDVQYRRLFEAAQDIILTMSPDGVITSLNPAFETITGWPRSEWQGRPFVAMLHPDDVPSAIDRFERIVSGEYLPRHQWRVLASSGEYLIMELLTTAETHQGRVTGLLGIARDVTRRVRAEEALRESETRFRSIWENSADGMRLTDANGKIVGVNQAFCRIVGMNSEQLMGKPVTITVPAGEDSPEMLRKYRKKFAERSIEARVEQELRLPSGKSRILDVTSSFVELDRGDALLLGIFRDITERKQAEKVIKESEERYRTVVETAVDAIVMIDEQSRILAINSAAERIFGHNTAEMLGRELTMLMPEFLRSIHKAGIERYVATGKKHISWDGIELTGLHKSGREIPVEISFGEFIKEGKRIFAGIIHDITERNQAEERIRMLAHTITNMNESVRITDLENNIIFVNTAFVKSYGYEREELIGKSISKVRLRGPGLTDQEIIRATLAGGWQGELTNRRKNGEEFPIRISTTALYDRQNTPVALVGISQDITEEKRLQHELEEVTRQRTEDLRAFGASVQSAQEEERRRIARELHDDFGQRLSGLKLNIEVFEDSVSDRKTLSKLAHVKKQIDTMINEIRRTSAALHPSALDDFGLTIAVQLLCREIEKSHRIKVRFQAKNLDTQRYPPPTEIALFRIAQEALSNAARHAMATGISLQLAAADEAIHLTIEDNGKGFNVNSVHAKKGSARGLGLISMRERSENLGGSYEVTSAPSKGTKVHVTIPVSR